MPKTGCPVHESTTSRRSCETIASNRITAPQVLFSVVTKYGSGQTIAEHFPGHDSRSAGLVDRAEQFYAAPGQIPDLAASLTDAVSTPAWGAWTGRAALGRTSPSRVDSAVGSGAGIDSVYRRYL